MTETTSYLFLAAAILLVIVELISLYVNGIIHTRNLLYYKQEADALRDQLKLTTKILESKMAKDAFVISASRGIQFITENEINKIGLLKNDG